jgi:hypothetical protein
MATVCDAMATVCDAMATVYDAMATVCDAMATVCDAMATVCDAMATVCAGLKGSKHPEYVQTYLDRFDNIPGVETRVNDVTACAQRVYDASLCGMDECYALAPIPIKGSGTTATAGTSLGGTPPAATPVQLSLTVDQLKQRVNHLEFFHGMCCLLFLFVCFVLCDILVFWYS